MAIKRYATVARCSSPRHKAKRATIPNFLKAKDASKMSTTRKGGKCESCWIAPARSIGQFIANERVVNASTVKPKNWASNDPKCVINDLFTT